MAGTKRKTSGRDSPSDADPGVTLNFKVSTAFKKQFKGFAVAEGVSMTELLKEGFILSQERRRK